MPGPTLPPSDDDAFLASLPISAPSLPNSAAPGPKKPNASRVSLEPSHFIDVGTGKPLLGDGDTVIAVNGIRTVLTNDPDAKATTVGSTYYQQTVQQLMAAKDKLEKLQSAGSGEPLPELRQAAIDTQMKLVQDLEDQKIAASQADPDTGQVKASRITQYGSSTTQGLKEIRRLTMPPHDGAPVTVAVRRKSGKLVYTKARYIGPVPARAETWDEDVQRWTEQLSQAAQMYKQAIVVGTPSIQIGEIPVLKQMMAFGKNPYERWATGPLMSSSPEAKLQAMEYTDINGVTTRGMEAVEHLKQMADKIFADTSREISLQIRDRATDESLPFHVRERAIQMLERLKGIIQKSPEAMASVVHSKGTVGQLRRDAAAEEKKAASLRDRGMDDSKCKARAQAMLAAADRLFNPEADKFEALIALVVYANLSRMGMGVGRFEKQPHQNTQTVKMIQGQPKPFHPPADDDEKIALPPRPSRAPGVSPRKPRAPGSGSSGGGSAPKKSGPSTPYTGPLPESMEGWANTMLFSILESKGAKAAIEFSRLAMADINEVLPKLQNGKVILFGFKANESFLNGLAGQIVEHDDSNVVVRLNDSDRVRSLLAEDDRTLRVTRDEIIIVGGMLR